MLKKFRTTLIYEYIIDTEVNGEATAETVLEYEKANYAYIEHTDPPHTILKLEVKEIKQ